MEEMSVGTGLAGEEAVKELSSRSVLVDGWPVCCDKQTLLMVTGSKLDFFRARAEADDDGSDLTAGA